MTITQDESGRFRQRRRTRAAIVDAASELLRTGVTPSVGDVAEAADVSRRTVYLHFPTIEQLLLDATFGLLNQTDVDDAIDAADTGGDASQRVEAMIRALCGATSETMDLGRALLRLTVDAPRDADGEGPRRGYRRVGWIERALAPIRPRFDAAGFERLVSALAMVAGWEALIVLQDVRGLSADEQVETSLWAARALLRAALDEAGDAAPARDTAAAELSDRGSPPAPPRGA
jgi:AcrR family transcriptional regulator